MKVLKITGKNLKLLMRSKTSIVAVIFGPLIIMLLVGFAFNNTSASRLNIGYYSPEQTELSESFVSALKTNPNFDLLNYDSEEKCTNNIEQAKAHICVIFPQDFRLENNKSNQIIFYVDQSRANFVYAIIDTVSSKISLTSTQLSYQLTNDLLNVIETTKQTNNEELLQIIKLKASVSVISDNLANIKSRLNSLDLSTSSVTTGSLSSQLATVQLEVTALKNKGIDVVQEAEDVIEMLDGHTDANGSSTVSNFEDSLVTLEDEVIDQYNDTNSAITSLSTSIDSLAGDVDKLNERLVNAKSTTADSALSIDKTITSLSELKTTLDELKSGTEDLNAQINSLRITSADSIVNPISTVIKPISSKSSNLNFIFPYFIILIIVFISIMLSSNIIIMEKTSKAYFRNFTTPTKDMSFMSSVFLTSFIVVTLQLIFVLALAYYFLNAAILGNIWLTILLIFMSITLFTLIGMVIGYMFNSQDAVTMTSISVGSVFLFLSNLVLPLESMSRQIQSIAQYNPYVLCSELLKKLTLFTTEWVDVTLDFSILAVYIIVVFILSTLVYKMSKIQFMSRRPLTKQLMKSDMKKFLKLKSGVLVTSEEDLLEELEEMDDKIFEQHLSRKRNDFEDWFKANKKNDLAKEIAGCRTKKEVISVLRKHVKVGVKEEQKDTPASTEGDDKS